jgi:hypothetical protein
LAEFLSQNGPHKAKKNDKISISVAVALSVAFEKKLAFFYFSGGP